jgi:PAS domain S-box-containing protein
VCAARETLKKYNDANQTTSRDAKPMTSGDSQFERQRADDAPQPSANTSPLDPAAEVDWLATARRQAEAALRDSELRYRQLANAMPHLVWTSNAAGVVDYYNSRASAYDGIRCDNDGRWTWQPIVHPDDIAATITAWQAAQYGTTYQHEHRLRMADGSYRWHLSRAEALRDEGQIVKWFGTATDIHERKRAEVRDHFLYQLLDSARVLTAPEAIIALVAQQLGQHLEVDRCAFAETEPDEDHFVITSDYTTPGTASLVGRFAMADFGAEALRLMRAGRPYVVENSATDVRIVAPEVYAAAQIEAVICIPLCKQGHFVAGMAVHQRTPRQWAADEVELVQLVANLCWESLERARLHRAEQRARAEAEAAVHARNQFLSLAAHELRTPLTSLLGNAQLLQRRAGQPGVLAERERRTVQVIAEQATRLNRMIIALLDVSRIEAGQLTIVRAPLDLCQLVRRIAEEVRPALDGRVLDVSCPDEPLVIGGDELRLEQVLQNLVQNALKYSPAGEPVRIEARAQADTVLLSVTDHGIGIPQAALPRLFQRFYRAHNVDPRLVSGMGIGLYVVKEIVALHGGTVEVTSSEGQGSTFTVRLPRAT